jgi:dTDP-4-dehydrorhamnose 3,5-epimerase-like enzyme
MTPERRVFEAHPGKRLDTNIYSTSIDGLLVVASDVFQDARGFFREVSVIPDIDKVTENEFHVN